MPEAPGLERLREKVRYLSLLTYVGSEIEGHARREMQELWVRLNRGC
jgi:hypothetical protein